MLASAKSSVDVLGTSIAYTESGSGDPILFLHGNPTSSYLWRNVIPHLTGLGRCIAPDLVGMGDSGPAPDGSYRFFDHARYLEAFLEELEIADQVTLVLHDWGGALGFDWARRHPSALKGIAYMETIVKPLALSDLPASVQPAFAALRSPAGEEMILEENFFVERILPGSIIRELEPDELDEYRRPFQSRDRRLPTLIFPRELPIDGDPSDIVEVVSRYNRWLAETPLPKLLIRADPGVLITGAALETCRQWPNQIDTAVAGKHFLQEDSPDEIGASIADWYQQL
jgi:haloalkane dehalogenase